MKNAIIIGMLTMAVTSLLAQDMTDTLAQSDHELHYYQSEYLPSGVAQSFLASLQFSSPDHLLQGGTAGTHTLRTSGKPGAPIATQVRGLRSLAGSNNPLYVIDGFPIFNDNALASSGLVLGPAIHGLMFWNTENIESIYLLKDAAATAMYGSRGANGVVLISTNKPSLNQNSLSVSVGMGTAQSFHGPQLLSGLAYATLQNNIAQQNGLTPPYPSSPRSSTNWWKAVERDQPLLASYRLDARMGNQTLALSLQAQYDQLQGTTLGSDLNRFSLQANARARVKPGLSMSNALHMARIDASSVGSDDDGLASAYGVYTAAQAFSPLIGTDLVSESTPRFNAVIGAMGESLGYLHSNQPYVHPLALAGAIDSRLVTTRLTDLFQLEARLPADLTLKLSAGVDAIFNEESLFIPGAIEYQTSPGGTGGGIRMQSFDWLTEAGLHYHREIGASDNLDIILGAAAQGYRRELLGGLTRGFENQTLRANSLGVGQRKFITSDRLATGLASFYARVKWSHRNLLEATILGRSDASSKNGGTHKIFPAASLSWNLKAMPFLINAQDISSLRMSLSLGRSGSLFIPPYQQLSVLGEVSGVLNSNNINGVTRLSLAAENLQFEITNKLNFGITSSLWDERLALTVDLYRNHTNNALAFVPTASQSGYSTALLNLAEVRNQGIEIGLTTGRESEKWQWEVQVQFSSNANQILDLGDHDELPMGRSILREDQFMILKEGASAGSFYGYQLERFDAGNPIYHDRNENGQIDPGDRTVIGSALPALIYGLGFNGQFRGLTAQIFLQGTIGNDILNLNELLIGQPDGQSNIREDLAGQTAQQPLRISDAMVSDGSYLRVKVVSLQYALPDSWLAKTKLKGLHIFLNGENLFTITGYPGVDPEVSHFGSDLLLSGIDFGGYPGARRFIGGVKLEL